MYSPPPYLYLALFSYLLPFLVIRCLSFLSSLLGYLFLFTQFTLTYHSPSSLPIFLFPYLPTSFFLVISLIFFIYHFLPLLSIYLLYLPVFYPCFTFSYLLPFSLSVFILPFLSTFPLSYLFLYLPYLSFFIFPCILVTFPCLSLLSLLPLIFFRFL